MQKIKLTYQSHDFFLEIAGFLTKNSDFGNRYLKSNRLFTFVMYVCGRKFGKKKVATSHLFRSRPEKIQLRLTKDSTS